MKNYSHLKKHENFTFQHYLLATMAEGWALAVVFYYLFCEPLPDVSSRPLVEGLGVTLSSVYLYKFFQENFPSSLARLYLPLRESALCFL